MGRTSEKSEETKFKTLYFNTAIMPYGLPSWTFQKIIFEENG